MSEKNERGFLERWSERKRAVGKPVVPGQTKVEASGQQIDEATRSVPLPNIDDLLPTSDVAAFLREGVSEELRRLALRKAWSIDPAIRDFIEVAENQYNWNAPDGVPGFGPLDAGGQLTDLLLQATGRVPKTENPKEPSELGEHPNQPPESAPQAKPNPESRRPEALASLEEQTQTSADANMPAGTKDELLTAQTENIAAQKRITHRHGGALPTTVASSRQKHA